MFQAIKPPDLDPLQSGITRFHQSAAPLFEQALRRGRLNKLIARLTGRSWRPLLLDRALSVDMIYTAQPSPMQMVDLRQIKGSVNRCDEFDRNFYPLCDRLQTRWVRIASMMLQETPLPPVELIRAGSIYFVVDGHHRVSVARALKHAAVDAVISAAYD